MSMARTWRAIFAIYNVNQPSPEQSSNTPMPGSNPMAASTPAGFGRSASHQPAVGILVPSKKPAGRPFMMKGHCLLFEAACYLQRLAIPLEPMPVETLCRCRPF